MYESLAHAAAAAAAIRSQWARRPRVGIILGSGLGDFARQVNVEARYNHESLPHFPRATALGHRGELLCGDLRGVGVVTMHGRCHLYEGYTSAQVTFAVRVMKALGVEILILTNACGGMNPAYRAGDLMVLDDHINFTFTNPLVGPHDAGSGLGYPDLSRPYDAELSQRALAIAKQQGTVAHRGVYVGVLGPNYETRAEYRAFRQIGGDAVGMSTVSEVIVAAQCGLRVLALSVVTNVCQPDALEPASGEQVVTIAAAAEPKLRAILLGVIEQEAASAIG